MSTEGILLGLDSRLWAEVGAIATAIYAVSFIVSLAFIYGQLRHMQISSMSTAFSKALDLLHDESRRQDRKIVFAMGAIPLALWTEEQSAAAERVIHSFDQVGTMIRAGMFKKELILDGWANSIRRAKPILMPLVRDYRTKWDADEIWVSFEWLADEAERYKKNRGKRSWRLFLKPTDRPGK
jgi:hypothetical protein